MYSGILKKMKFVLNPYDRCIANKIIHGSQCMIVFYVGDNKISHQDPAVVTEVIQEIEKYFGKLSMKGAIKMITWV